MKLKDEDLTDIVFGLAFLIVIISLLLFTQIRFVYVSMLFFVCIFALWLFYYNLKVKKELEKRS